MSNESLPSDLRARVLHAAKSEPSPDRARVRRSLVAAIGAGALVSLAVLFVVGGPDFTARPPAFLALTVAGFCAIAALATWGGVARGQSMLGRPRSWLVTIAMVTAPSLFAWVVMGTSIWPETRATAPADMARNIGCFVVMMLLALGPFAALMLSRRASDPVNPRATGGAVGAAAGAWAGVLIHLHCPVSVTMHVALSHVLPIVIFSLIGTLVGRRVIGLKVFA